MVDRPPPALLSEPWQICSICQRIPARAYALYKSGETLENTFPPETDKLLVVGAPFYNTDTSAANHCLMKCPACGTVYAWDFTYEYLVNGTEDEYVLTRLSHAEGTEREQDILKNCKDKQKRKWKTRKAIKGA